MHPTVKVSVKVCSLWLCLMVLSCATVTTRGKVRNTMNKQLPAASTIPMRVALYLSPQFTTYEYVPPSDTLVIHVFPIGSLLCDGARKVAKAAFAETVEFTGPEKPDLQKAKLDALVMPEVTDVRFNFAGGINATCTAQVGLKWTVISADGRTLFFNTTTGEGAVAPSSVMRTVKYVINNAGGDSLSDAADSAFQKSFEALTGSGSWWATNPPAKQ